MKSRTLVTTPKIVRASVSAHEESPPREQYHEPAFRALQGLQQASDATRDALLPATSEQGSRGQQASKVLMSALKTKSELYESVRQIMQEDFAQSLLASSSICSAPSHRPVATHISQEDLGRYVSAHYQDSDMDTSRDNRSRAPSDSDRHVEKISSKLPLRRTTPSGVLSAADSMRLSRKFESPRRKGPSRGQIGYQSRRLRMGEGDSIGKYYQREAVEFSDYSHRDFDGVRWQPNNKDSAAITSPEHHRPAAGGANITSQTISQRTIHAQVPGLTGGVWQEDEMQIQFRPWNGKGVGGSRALVSHWTNEPHNMHYEEETIARQDPVETPNESFSFVPCQVHSNNSGVTRVHMSGRNAKKESAEIFDTNLAQQTRSHSVLSQKVGGSRAPAEKNKSCKSGRLWAATLLTAWRKLAARSTRNQRVVLRFKAKHRFLYISAYRHPFDIWWFLSIRHRTLDRISSHVKSRIVQRGGDFLVGISHHFAFRTWKAARDKWQRKKRALAIVTRWQNYRSKRWMKVLFFQFRQTSLEQRHALALRSHLVFECSETCCCNGGTLLHNTDCRSWRRQQSSNRQRSKSRAFLNRALGFWILLVNLNTRRVALATSFALCICRRGHRVTMSRCYSQWRSLNTGADGCVKAWEKLCMGLLIRHIGGRGWREWRLWRLHASRNGEGSRWSINDDTYESHLTDSIEIKVLSLCRQRRNYLLQQREKLSILAVAILLWRRLCTERSLELIARGSMLVIKRYLQGVQLEMLRWWQRWTHAWVMRRKNERSRSKSLCRRIWESLVKVLSLMHRRASARKKIRINRNIRMQRVCLYHLMLLRRRRNQLRLQKAATIRHAERLKGFLFTICFCEWAHMAATFHNYQKSSNAALKHWRRHLFGKVLCRWRIKTDFQSWSRLMCKRVLLRYYFLWTLRVFTVWVDEVIVSEKMQVRCITRFRRRAVAGFVKTWRDNVDSARYVARVMKRIKRCRRRSLLAMTGKKWKDYSENKKISRQCLMRHKRRQEVVCLTRNMGCWRESHLHDMILKSRLERRQNECTSKNLRCAATTWIHEYHRKRLLYSMAARQARTVRNEILQRWQQAIWYQRRRQRFKIHCIRFRTHSAAVTASLCFVHWTFLAKKAQSASRVLRHWFCYQASRAFNTWKEEAKDERLSRQVCARTVRIGRRKILQAALCIWKFEWMHHFQIHRQLCRHVVLVKVYVLYGWHESVRKKLLSNRNSINMINLRQKMLLKKVLHAWSWRREITRMRLRRHARSSVRLLGVFLRRWEEAVGCQRHTKRMFLLCFKFRSRLGIAEVCACFFAWSALACDAKEQANLFNRVRRQWIGFVAAKAFRTWAQEAEEERVSRQVCSRTVRIGGRKLLQSALLLWKDMFVGNSHLQRGLRKFEERIKMSVLSEWLEAVRLERYKKLSKDNMGKRHAYTFLRQVVQAWHLLVRLVQVVKRSFTIAQKRLKRASLRCWGEAVVLCIRISTMHARSMRFRKKVEQRANAQKCMECFKCWRNRARNATIRSKALTKMFQRRCIHTRTRTLFAWKLSAIDKRRSRVLSARTVRKAEQTCIAFGFLRWKDVWYGFSATRRIVQQISRRSKVRTRMDVMICWKCAVLARRHCKVLECRCNRRQSRCLCEQSFLIWSCARDSAMQDRFNERRLSSLYQRHIHHQRRKLLVKCLQAWEIFLLKQETTLSRAKRVDLLLWTLMSNKEQADRRASFLAWSRFAAISSMRRTGFKRAKRRWLGYSTRAVVFRFFDIWKDDTGCERKSRQVCARSSQAGARKQLQQVIDIWQGRVADSTLIQKTDRMLFRKIWKNTFQLRVRVVSEWREAVHLCRLRSRLKSRVRHQGARRMKRLVVFAWHSAAESELSASPVLTNVQFLRRRSNMRQKILTWRWMIDDKQLALRQALCTWRKSVKLEYILYHQVVKQIRCTKTLHIAQWIEAVKNRTAVTRHNRRLLRFCRAHLRRALLSKKRAHLTAWYSVTRLSILWAQWTRVISSRFRRTSLKEILLAWMQKTAEHKFLKKGAGFRCQKSLSRLFRIWVQRQLTLNQHKKCKLAAGRVKYKGARALKAQILQLWRYISTERRLRMKWCMFFNQKCNRTKKVDSFRAWIEYHRWERDLVVRVQYESEMVEQKLHADMALCQRLIQRYNWRRYQRQIHTAFIGWHVYCVNRKHIQIIDHMFCKKYTDQTRRASFLCWKEMRHFSRLIKGFLNRLMWRKKNISFVVWKRSARREERIFWQIERTFTFVPRTKLKVALQRWLHISRASLPLLRSSLNRVKYDRWITSLLLRVSLHAWEKHVRDGMRCIHTKLRITASHLRIWRLSLFRRKRARRICSLIRRNLQRLAIMMKLICLGTWKATRFQTIRLRKAKIIWIRRLISKVLNTWKGQVAFEKISRQTYRRYLCQCQAQQSIRILGAWQKYTAFKKRSRQMNHRSVRNAACHTARRYFSCWQEISILEQMSRQLSCRSDRKARHKNLKCCFARYINAVQFRKMSNFVRQRATCKRKGACMGMWQDFRTRIKQCQHLSVVIAVLVKRVILFEALLCFVSWARLTCLGRSHAKQLAKAQHIRAVNVKASICMTWNQESFDLRVSRQLQAKSDRTGKRRQQTASFEAWMNFVVIRCFRRKMVGVLMKRSQLAIKRRCFRSWCQVGNFQKILRVRKSQFLLRRHQRHRSLIVSAWRSRCDFVERIPLVICSKAIKSIEVREIFVVWFLHVYEHTAMRRYFAERAAVRAFQKYVGVCFKLWCDLSRVGQLHSAINLLVEYSDTVRSRLFTCVGAHDGDNQDGPWQSEKQSQLHEVEETHRISLFALNLAAKLFCRGNAFGSAFIRKSELLELAVDATKIQQFETQNNLLEEELSLLREMHRIQQQHISQTLKHIESYFKQDRTSCLLEHVPSFLNFQQERIATIDKKQNTFSHMHGGHGVELLRQIQEMMNDFDTRLLAKTDEINQLSAEVEHVRLQKEEQSRELNHKIFSFQLQVEDLMKMFITTDNSVHVILDEMSTLFRDVTSLKFRLTEKLDGTISRLLANTKELMEKDCTTTEVYERILKDRDEEYNSVCTLLTSTEMDLEHVQQIINTYEEQHRTELEEKSAFEENMLQCTAKLEQDLLARKTIEDKLRIQLEEANKKTTASVHRAWLLSQDIDKHKLNEQGFKTRQAELECSISRLEGDHEEQVAVLKARCCELEAKMQDQSKMWAMEIMATDAENLSCRKETARRCRVLEAKVEETGKQWSERCLKQVSELQAQNDLLTLESNERGAIVAEKQKELLLQQKAAKSTILDLQGQIQTLEGKNLEQAVKFEQQVHKLSCDHQQRMEAITDHCSKLEDQLQETTLKGVALAEQIVGLEAQRQHLESTARDGRQREANWLQQLDQACSNMTNLESVVSAASKTQEDLNLELTQKREEILAQEMRHAEILGKLELEREAERAKEREQQMLMQAASDESRLQRRLLTAELQRSKENVAQQVSQNELQSRELFEAKEEHEMQLAASRQQTEKLQEEFNTVIAGLKEQIIFLESAADDTRIREANMKTKMVNYEQETYRCQMNESDLKNRVALLEATIDRQRLAASRQVEDLQQQEMEIKAAIGAPMDLDLSIYACSEEQELTFRSKLAIYAQMKAAADEQAMLALKQQCECSRIELRETQVRASAGEIKVAEMEGQLSVLLESNTWLQEQLNAERTKFDTVLAAHVQKTNELSDLQNVMDNEIDVWSSKYLVMETRFSNLDTEATAVKEQLDSTAALCLQVSEERDEALKSVESLQQKSILSQNTILGLECKLRELEAQVNDLRQQLDAAHEIRENISEQEQNFSEQKFLHVESSVTLATNQLGADCAKMATQLESARAELERAMRDRLDLLDEGGRLQSEIERMQVGHMEELLELQKELALLKAHAKEHTDAQQRAEDQRQKDMFYHEQEQQALEAERVRQARTHEEQRQSELRDVMAEREKRLKKLEEDQRSELLQLEQKRQAQVEALEKEFERARQAMDGEREKQVRDVQHSCEQQVTALEKECQDRIRELEQELKDLDAARHEQMQDQKTQLQGKIMLLEEELAVSIKKNADQDEAIESLLDEIKVLLELQNETAAAVTEGEAMVEAVYGIQRGLEENLYAAQSSQVALLIDAEHTNTQQQETLAYELGKVQASIYEVEEKMLCLQTALWQNELLIQRDLAMSEAKVAMDLRHVDKRAAQRFETAVDIISQRKLSNQTFNITRDALHVWGGLVRRKFFRERKVSTCLRRRFRVKVSDAWRKLRRIVAVEHKVNRLSARHCFRARKHIFTSWARHWRQMEAFDSCCKRVMQAQYLQGSWASKSLHFAVWLRVVSLIPVQRELSRGVVEELNGLIRHRDLARQNHKMAGVESAFARLESARVLDNLIVSLQEQVAKSRSPSPSVRSREGKYFANLGEGRAEKNEPGVNRVRSVPQSSSNSSWSAGNIIMDGLEGASDVIDSVLNEGGEGGSNLDFEALMALSQTVGLNK